jgi:chaperone modulatory protein CbpM
MVTEFSDASWLDPQRRIDQAELACMCSLSIAELDELVEYGALLPAQPEGAGLREFSGSCVGPLREAVRLRSLYDLDLFTVSLLLGYLQRIVQLEHQLRSLQAQLPHGHQPPREGPTPWREPHS